MFAQLVSDHCRFETIEATGDLDAVPKCSNEELKKHWPDLVETRWCYRMVYELYGYQHTRYGLSFHMYVIQDDVYLYIQYIYRS